MDFSSIVSEDKIKRAYQEGEFNNLPGFGKPLPKDSLAAVPQELRMAYRILKNSGYSIEENELKQELLTIEDLIKACTDKAETAKLQTKYNQKLIQFHQIMKKRTGTSHSKLFGGYQQKVEDKLSR